jgi:hypothetical protein
MIVIYIRLPPGLEAGPRDARQTRFSNVPTLR